MSAIAKPSAGSASFVTGTNQRAATITGNHQSSQQVMAGQTTPTFTMPTGQVVTPPVQPQVYINPSTPFNVPAATVSQTPSQQQAYSFTAPPADRKTATPTTATVVMPPARSSQSKTKEAVHPNNPLPPMQPDAGMTVEDKGTVQQNALVGSMVFGPSVGASVAIPGFVPPSPTVPPVAAAPTFVPPVTPVVQQTIVQPAPPAAAFDFAGMTNGSTVPSTSTPTVSTPSPFPTPPTVQASPFAPQPVVQATSTSQSQAQSTSQSAASQEDLDELKWSNGLSSSINAAINKVAYECGVRLLEDRNLYDATNKIHEAIWMMRWNSDGLVQMAPAQLCSYEAALTAHQVYVAAQENYWTQKYNFMGKEKDRLFREARNTVDAKTEKDKENLIIRTSPHHRNLFSDFRMAEAICLYMKDFGARFAQLQNGLKRTIDLAIAERQTALHQSRSSN